MHTQTHAVTHQLTHTHTHRAKAHNHTNKHARSITLIRLLSPLHLYQTKQAAADDGVSTTGITFLVIFCPRMITKQEECLVLFRVSA